MGRERGRPSEDGSVRGIAARKTFDVERDPNVMLLRLRDALPWIEGAHRGEPWSQAALLRLYQRLAKLDPRAQPEAIRRINRNAARRKSPLTEADCMAVIDRIAARMRGERLR